MDDEVRSSVVSTLFCSDGRLFSGPKSMDNMVEWVMMKRSAADEEGKSRQHRKEIRLLICGRVGVWREKQLRNKKEAF